MVKQLVLISGNVSSGKSTLSKALQDTYEFKIFKTRDYLRQLNPQVGADRISMQEFGETLDRKTKGRWVSIGIEEFISKNNLKSTDTIIVDAVRIDQQISAVRDIFKSRVMHIHLDAPIQELMARYKNRRDEGIKEFQSYDKVLENKTESNVHNLMMVADVVINTKLCTQMDVVIKAASHLDLYGREAHRLVDVLVGGQYGSEGKGHIASYLAHEYGLLIRTGGPNAGHTVYYNNKHITFHHLPSGSLHAPYADLLIGPGATIYIPKLQDEISATNRAGLAKLDRCISGETALE